MQQEIQRIYPVNTTWESEMLRVVIAVHLTFGKKNYTVQSLRCAAEVVLYNYVKSDTPSYSQLYILDPEYANIQRLNNEQNEGCKRDIMNTIDCLLRDINPFAQAFKMMKDLIDQRGYDQSPGRATQITKDRQHDPRRYNLPTANEVAAVFVSDDGEPPIKRDIPVHPIGQRGLQNIVNHGSNCDPMVYPFIFPYGEHGWQPGIRKQGRTAKRKSHEMEEEFYAYRLQDRQSFNPLLHSGKLTQQYINDAYLKVEAQRLDWNRQNQKKLRVELYVRLMDYINSRAEQQNLRPGRIVILPSSFTVGKRAMTQNYQDAMTLVAKFGKPDLFITFTCNPKWEEIQSGLLQHETATDRPDLVSTIFHLTPSPPRVTVKYIFKYLYKGHDAAIVQVNEVSNSGTYHWDEIKTYIDT
ncbi:uncharacterized protein [Dendrobates tinctorius]|uniref:uncharacterized protein n=1 Tax=Dendrobates tinctorius TaxID=92724 RepID=UPI003CC93438